MDNGIRPITNKDISKVVNLHLKVLPNSIEARFGESFCRLFYESLVDFEGFFCDGFFLEEQLIGLIVYVKSAKNTFGKVFIRNILRFLICVIRSVIESPCRFNIVVKAASFILFNRCEPGLDIEFEGLHIAVLPEYRRSSRFGKESGINVAKELHKTMIDKLKGMNAKGCKNMPFVWDKADIAFNRREGYEFVGKTTRFGNELCVYVKKF